MISEAACHPVSAVSYFARRGLARRSNTPLLLGITTCHQYHFPMHITWEDASGEVVTERVLEPYRRYCELIGLNAAAQLFLKLGGSHVYINFNRAPAKGRLVEAIGQEAAAKLCAGMRGGTNRVPLGNVFLCRYFRSCGLSVDDIARRLRLSDVAVRHNLKSDAARRDRAAALKASRQ